MLRLLIMSLSLISVVAIYIHANIIKLNGHSTAEITNRLPVLFTPAKFTLLIWVLIYLLLSVWIVKMWRNRREINDNLTIRTILFTIGCIFNIAWLYVWHYEQYMLTTIMLFGLLLSLFLLYSTYSKSTNEITERMPISIFFGWSFFTLMSNISYALTYYEWSGWGLSDPLWVVIFLTISTAFALHFRYHYNDIPMVFVFIWGFIGIVIKNGFDELFISVAGLFLCGVLIFGLFFIRKT